ncbi:MAG: hypothetical protein ABJE95_21930 [Byssovorax sp.]
MTTILLPGEGAREAPVRSRAGRAFALGQWIEREKVHCGMGTMEADCKTTISKPWK